MKSPTVVGRPQELPLIEAVGTSSGWRSWAKAVEPVPDPSLHTDTYGMALHLAALGSGVALVNEWLAGHALRQGLVELSHPASIPAHEAYHLSVASKKPEAAELCAWLVSENDGVAG